VPTAPAAGRGTGGPEPSNDIPFSIKRELVDENGMPYREFRRSLTPRWGSVWAQIGLRYAALLGILAALAAFADLSPAGVALAALGGVAIGYTVATLSLFFHEAAHYNLVRGRRRNDRAANLVIAWMYGRPIAAYRRTHLQHHRDLGTTMDAENSYFEALGAGYLAAGLFGIKAMRSLRRYREIERAELGQTGEGATARIAWIAVTAAAALGVAAALWLVLGAPLAAAAWLWGLLFVYPFFASLRQLLEHRSEGADREVDYQQVDHGPVNRLFGDGPIASTLGSAGFNRHALHHWEPTVSCTRLKDLEAYLSRTPLEPSLRKRRTTYADTFLRLLEL
jgi:fatty acid desaturase